MKEYKKKFVILNMISIGIVLLAVMIGIGVYNAKSSYSSIKNTMSQVIEPYEGNNSQSNPALSKMSESPSPNGGPGSSEAADAPDAPGVPSASQSTEVADNSDSSQSTKTADNSSASQSTEVADNSDSSQSTEVADNSDSSQSTEVADNSDSSQSTEVADNSDSSQSTGASDNSDSSQSTEASDSSTSKPPEIKKPSSKKSSLLKQHKITALVYKKDEDSYSLITKNSEYEDDWLISVISETLETDSDFGYLSGYGILYYKSESDSTMKLAFTEIGYFTVPLIKLGLTMLGIFIIAMLIIFFISKHMAYMAVQPLEQSINMEKRFITDISHDLKTPLTIILANSSILKKHEDSSIESQMNWIESSENAAENMLDMINEMLTLSSVDESANELKKETIDLSNLTEQLTLQMESIAYERDITLSTDIKEGISVESDKYYVTRIITCLLDNALKHEKIGGEIHVKLYKDNKNANLIVKNISSFISEEDLPHIFERFYRSDKARGTNNGYGLGLSIAKSMTDALHGSLEAISSESDGTTFIFHI